MDFYAAVVFEANTPPVYYSEVEAPSANKALAKVREFRDRVNPSIGLGHVEYKVYISSGPFEKIPSFISFKQAAGY